MKKNLRTRFRGLAIALLAAITIAQPLSISAATEPVGELSLRAITPDNQIDKNQTYYDLLVTPGQKQTLQMTIFNSASEDITVNLSVNPATTSRNGLIVYTNGEAGQNNAKYNIKDIATLPQTTLKMKANTQTTVEINLNIPTESFSGVILGGIVVSATKEVSGDSAGADSIALQNDYNYVVGLKLTEENTAVSPDLQLKSIQPTLVNHYTALTVQLQNTEPTIIKNMKVNATVYDKKTNAAIKSLNLQSAAMAPNTVGDFVIDWESQALSAGTYRLHMTAEHEGRVWEWDEDFTITATDASDINKDAVGLGNSWWLALLLITLVLLALTVIVLIIMLRRRKRDHEHLSLHDMGD